MRIYTYSKEKPEEGTAIKASQDYGPDFYLIPTKLSKEEKEALMAEIATYHVKVREEEEVEWDCDSSRSSDSSSFHYIEVPTAHIVLKDGAFWGYRTESVSWWGGATSEDKTKKTVVVSIDQAYPTTVYDYSVTTSDYDRTVTTGHLLEKK